jgi:hypothetical protein
MLSIFKWTVPQDWDEKGTFRNCLMHKPILKKICDTVPLLITKFIKLSDAKKLLHMVFFWIRSFWKDGSLVTVTV